MTFNYVIHNDLKYKINKCIITLYTIDIKNKMKYTTTTDTETKHIGSCIADQLKGGDIVCLYGDLGAGKTTLVKGIADKLKIQNNITSPSFSLMNIYDIKNNLQLVHIDTYRLDNEEDLIDIGIEDYLGQKNSICIIEWPEKILRLLKDKKSIDLIFKHINKDQREIDIKSIDIKI